MTKATLNNSQLKFLRKLAHSLKPVISIADKGLSEALMREAELTLEHHELIKVKISADDRDQKKAIIDLLCQKMRASLIQSIGNVAVIYRPAATPKLEVPKK